jgi:hypothetical protein
MFIHPALRPFYLTSMIFGLALITNIIYFVLRYYVASRDSTKKLPSFAALFIYILILAVCYAIAIPNTIKFAGFAKQKEGETNLGAIYFAQISYFSRTNTYAGGPEAFKLINWEPVNQNRYAYFCGDQEIENNLPEKGVGIPSLQQIEMMVSIQPQSSKTGFTCMAAGNIDNDNFWDVWMINDHKELVCLMDDENNINLDEINLGKAALSTHARAWLLYHATFAILFSYFGLWVVFIILYRRKFGRDRSAKKRSEVI